MICPKCGFEQPDGVECMRCGVIISRYKGPVVGAAGSPGTPPAFAPAAASPPPSFIPPPPVIAGGRVLAPAGGAGFGDPPPASPSGGTVYGGPGSIAPTFSSIPGASFHGTFETGKILGETFSTYFSNIIPFLLLSALALSPLLLFSGWASTLPASQPMAQLAPSLALFLQVFCAPIATAAITYGVYEQMRGRSPSIGDCLKVGLATLFPLIGLGIVQGFGVGCASLACLVPGIILAVRWAVAIPSKVEERGSISDALNRSTYLTDGFRWQVFGVVAVLGVLGVVLAVILLLAFGGKQSGSYLFASHLLQVATTGVSATANAVMYYRLRSLKESIDVGQISSVFA